MKKTTALILAIVILVSSAVISVAREPDKEIETLITEEISSMLETEEFESEQPATTEAPATQPTTKAPTTSAPTTKAPTTAAPTTKAPTTKAPTTKAPTTKAPTTKAPTTKAPAPTTQAKKVIRYGDIDCDYRVTAKDARWVLQFSARLVLFTNKMCRLADVNKDGRINASDARTVLRTSAKLETLPEFKETVANADEFVAKYGKYEPYQPSLAGFSTNIDDPAVFPYLKKLEGYLAALGNTATMYYQDVEGRYYIAYNADRVYRTQCTIKAPYSKAILQYMEKKNIPLEKQLMLTSSAKWDGHYVSGFASGTYFTIAELIRYAITLSDNTAYQVLFDYFGNKPFNDNNAAAGSYLRLGSYIFGENSARDMAKLYLDIYNYKGKYRDFLYTQMNNNNTSTSDMIGGGIPADTTVLHKWGSGGSMTVGLHDCGIVYNKMPFVLIIYTSFNFDRWFDHIPFRRIAEYCNRINLNTAY